MKRIAGILSIALAIVLSFPIQAVASPSPSSQEAVVINEIESDDPNGGADWVELTNNGTSAVDVSGWFVTDDKGLERKTDGKTSPIAEGTILQPGAFLVLENGQAFDFGLGKSDTVMLFDDSENQVDSYAYESVAAGTWSRQPDGVFADAPATKGAVNASPSSTPSPDPAPSPDENAKLVINEINSSPDDWVELMNTGTDSLDLSGYELRDNADDHRWRFPEGSMLEAGKLLVVDAKSVGQVYDDQTGSYAEGTFESAIGIGSGDSIRLFDASGKLLDEYSWTQHASYDGDAAKASYGRYPDGTGAFCLTKETKGQANEWYAPTVVINEVESNGDATDWVEVMNTGTQPVDISGWYLLDNDPVGHKAETTPLAQGTVLEPGALYVFDQNRDFTFGLGSQDSATVYNKDGVIVATYAWDKHADGVYARIPDGTGAFQDFSPSTKGKPNKAVNPVVINEVQSNDPQGGPDWVELANPTSAELDISGLVLKDEKDKDSYTIPDHTSIPANGFIVIKQDDTGKDGFKFGLGKGDSVRLFENGEQIASTTWPAGTHTDPTWGLYPDVNGKEYRNTSAPTPGAPNKFADIPDVIAWPGSDQVRVFDTEPTFLEDSSGLDFADGKLYAVDNGTATFWELNVSKDGSLALAPGFEKGKRVAFQKDADNPDAKGPDTEGITVDGAGMVYLASERDNGAKGVNYDTILMVNPDESGSRLVAKEEWNLTSSLPQVSANMGIEAVEWVPNADVEGKLVDQNTGKAFDAGDYPDAVAGGVFFVALEDNGHVYAYVLNADGSVAQVADIDSKLGGAMGLDYDAYGKALWVATDDGYGNKMAKIELNGTATPDIVHVLPAAGVDTKANNEGFAIADASYTVNGQRPVYRFCDGVKSGALTIGSMDCDYQVSKPDEPSNPSNPSNPSVPSNPATPVNPSAPSQHPSSAITDKLPSTGDAYGPALIAAVLMAGAGIGLLAASGKLRTRER